MQLKESSCSQVWKMEIFPAVMPEIKGDVLLLKCHFIPYPFVVWGFFLAPQNKGKKFLFTLQTWSVLVLLSNLI